MIAAPPLYPDELVSSAMVRCSRWFMLPMTRLSRLVLNRTYQTSFLAALGSLRETAALFRTSPDDLLWNHTNFPYASAFVHRHQFETALGNTHELNDFGHLSSVMKNATAGIDHLRICKQCLDEDVAEHGESFWHRSHNLPGALFCATHRCVLHVTSLHGKNMNVTKLPIECELAPVPEGWISPGALELALRSQQLLTRQIGVGEQRLPEFYLSLATHRGWLTEGSQLCRDAVTEMVLRSFSGEFLRAASAQLYDSHPWPLHAFSGKNLCTLKHLIVEVALQLNDGHSGILDHIPVRTTPRKQVNENDERLSALVEVELAKVLQEGVQLTTRQFLQRLNGGQNAYVSRKDYPKLSAAVRRFRMSAAARSLRKPVDENDERLSALGEAEIFKLLQEGSKLTTAQFLQQLKVSEYIYYGRKELYPKLRATVRRFRMSAAFRPLRKPADKKDERLSALGEVEIFNLLQEGAKLTIGQLLQRLKVSDYIYRHRKEDYPMLCATVRRFQMSAAATRRILN